MLSALIGNLCASINKDIHFSLIGDLVDPYKQHRVASEQLVFEPILSLGLFCVMRCIVQLDRKVHEQRIGPSRTGNVPDGTFLKSRVGSVIAPPGLPVERFVSHNVSRTEEHADIASRQALLFLSPASATPGAHQSCAGRGAWRLNSTIF